MSIRIVLLRRAAIVFLACAPATAAQPAQSAASSQNPQTQTTDQPPRFDTAITVTTNRTEQKQIEVPSSIAQISGAELQARGVTTLADALSLLPGLEISHGGDDGPQMAGVALWGLREFDAYALMVDGVPVGGVYNPNTAFVPIEDIDRIEVQKGPNGVLYGQTAFAGVIQVFTKSAQAGRRGTASVHGGSLGTVGAQGTLDYVLGNKVLRLSFLGQRQGGWQPRAGSHQERVEISVGKPLAAGAGQLRITGRVLNWKQGFGAPFPRAGAEVDPNVDPNENYAVKDAEVRDRIVMGTVYFDRPIGRAGLQLVNTTSVSFDSQSRIRGFLSSVEKPVSPAQGSALAPEQLDIFEDIHVEWRQDWNGRSSLLQAGGGYQFGRLEAEARLFDYDVSLLNPAPPASTDLEAEEAEFFNRRDFGGVYVDEQLAVNGRFSVGAGVRLAFTREHARVGGDKPGEESIEDHANHVAPNYRATATYRLVSSGRFFANAFGSFNHAFKPAAVNFAEPEAQGPILDPETANAGEGGVKIGTNDGRLYLQASVFQMNFENLVVSQVENGVIVLRNAGAERFRGLELDGELAPLVDRPLRVSLGYAFHNPIFTQFSFLDDEGNEIVVDGNRLELAPQHLWNAGVSYAPSGGVGGFLYVHGAGSRPVNRRNSAFAPAYTVVDLGASYRAGRYRLVGSLLNVGDSRHIIAESELADAQIYLNPPRRGTVELRVEF